MFQYLELKFENQSDKHRVLHGRLWLFDSFLFSLQQTNGWVPPTKIDFSKEVSWVHMHNLPLACMNKAKGNSIGKTIGTVMECDVNEEGIGWEKVIRILIEINIYQPIPRGQTINVFGVVSWIPLTFENLPRICLKWGKISNDSNFYEKGSQKMNTRLEQFGLWLGVDRNKKFRWKAWVMALLKKIL